MKLVIPLAGFGSRMRPHTWTKPKPLISVAGKPFLGHLLDKFASLQIDELVIIYGWLGDQIKAYVEAHYAHLNPWFVEQTELHGQSHALWQAREHLHGDGIVVYVDTFFEGDLSVLNCVTCDGVAFVKRVDDPRRFGVVELDADGHVTRFTEKPAEPECVPGKSHVALASMGIYIFSMEFLTNALIHDAEDETSQHDFGKNIIPAAIQNAKSFAYPYLNTRGEPDYWRDVGSLFSYWKANIELCDIEPELNLYERDWPIWTYQSQSPPAKFAFDDEGRRGQAIDSLVAGGCIISGAKVKRSVIFFNTQIETGTYVRKSVVLPKVRIGKNCLIKNCIIDKGTVIPDGFQIGVDPEEDRRRFIVTDEGIVLVTPGMMNQRLHYERD